MINYIQLLSLVLYFYLSQMKSYPVDMLWINHYYYYYHYHYYSLVWPNYSLSGLTPTGTLISPKPLSHCLTTLSRQLDCLDPRYHQRIAVLFSSYSSESNNSPRPCISPWYGASFIVCLFVTGAFCCLYMCLSVFLLLLVVVYMSMNLITKWQLQTSISFWFHTPNKWERTCHNW